MEKILHIVARLRDPVKGCPWDREQSFQTIAPYTIEEAYEVADAINRDDMEDLKDELGDLLFQIAFHSQLAQERGAFDFSDVIQSIQEKMTRRHPHVFGGQSIQDAQAQTTAWENHKLQERQKKQSHHPAGQMDGVAKALPALTRAHKLQRRAAEVGFDWPDIPPVVDKIREELDEVTAEIDHGNKQQLEEELGDLLFACVNLTRHLGIQAETALRKANDKFSDRFRLVEKELDRRGQAPHETSLEEMEEVWNQIKKLTPEQF